MKPRSCFGGISKIVPLDTPGSIGTENENWPDRGVARRFAGEGAGGRAAEAAFTQSGVQTRTRTRMQSRMRSTKPRRPGCFKPPEIDVRAIRAKAKMTKAQFARCFGIPVETLRHWERGDRKPRGAALVLLHVIERDPRAVI